MTMIEQSPPAVQAGEFPPGIVCRTCGTAEWRVTRTRLGFACIRRWRTCAGCGHKVRTTECIEADAHPDRDAA